MDLADLEEMARFPPAGRRTPSAWRCCPRRLPCPSAGWAGWASPTHQPV